MVVAHFPLAKYWKGIPLAVESFLARRIGWYLFIFAQKSLTPEKR